MAATRMDAVQYESYGRGPFRLKHVKVAIPSPKKDEDSEMSVLQNRGAFLSGVAYWIAKGSSEKCSFILSFELGSEVFQKILLDLVDGKDCYCDAWVLEADTWKKIRTICIPPRGFVACPLGFRTNSRVHIVVFGLDFSGELVLYDPVSYHVKYTGIKMHRSDLPYVDASQLHKLCFRLFTNALGIMY
ncbi:F-box/kelch-repeat protein [Pyrus ussuriensis x Pyrus communis]|uniref:F-box/kelch-repeat protein n=1 Tax=Pyrus ussuriensis x Pyrus communis TaxID=2448454 RepID=A0A5N5F1S5_9ROSA|nr:F-box/kelch-repeat protein [Pyrus ussuriensis x Pyrus communis]